MKNTRKTLARVLMVVMVVCLLACTVLPMGAFAANEKITEASKGVLQVLMTYKDENYIYQSSGTGFLINDNTVITCDHVVHFDDSEMAAMMAITGKTEAEIKSRMYYEVTVTRDVTVGATVVQSSYDMDFAILRLETSIQGRVALPLRSSSTVKQTEKVYSVGFPVTTSEMTAVSTYTYTDATITDGTVSKIADGVNLWSGQTTGIIYTTCALDFGNSGGPMLDENGNVIGISQGFARASANSPDVYQAVAIDEVIEVLDALGFGYNKAGATATTTPEPTTAPTVEHVEETTPVIPAPTATVPQNVTGNASTGFSIAGLGGATLIIIIAAVLAVLVVVIVVVIIIIAGGKKKAATAPATMPPVQRPVPPMQGGFVPPAPVVPQAPTAAVHDAGETTVLSGDAGETTVLSKNVNGGTLIRKRTGETISINAEQFVIGRERKSVNYCISDNSSISRNHVRLTVRNGVTYLTDLNAANGTSVNGVKAMPRQEIALKSGDKITLADEGLEFKA